MQIKLSIVELCSVIPLVLSACGITKAENKDTDGPFEYKEIYLPEHSTEEYKELGLNNLDNDWGLWGHNLMGLLPDEPSKSVYARKSDGSTSKSQLCFSSDKLFEYICDYIDTHYSSGSSRFAILPNDNATVCMCHECVVAGNTVDDASPAVNNLITRLARRYSSHTFFTSSYRSTKSLPNQPLPDNTGVLISAIDYPLSTAQSPKDTEFEKAIRDWAQKTGNVYIWDYVNDFDDYFTPYPVFSSMQKRFRMYRDAGVKGIFLNGSGDDFSTFSRLKTLVLAELLSNPDADWKDVLMRKSRELYPVTGQTIAEFMIAQENYVNARGKELPLYKGVETAIDTYLPADEFITFHDRLLELLPQTRGTEREEILPMARAMELTRLELMRIGGNLMGYSEHLENLKKIHTENGIEVYSEVCWPVMTYVKDFEQIANRWSTVGSNKFKGTEVTSMSRLDPLDQNVGVLTDGMLGMTSNYHNGIVINSPDELWRFNIPATRGLNKIRLWMVVNPAFKMGLPLKVVLTAHDRLLSQTQGSEAVVSNKHAYLDIEVPAYTDGPYVLTLVRDPDVRIMAVEEIEGF